MPLFFQHDIDDSTKLGIWLIEEEEGFFLKAVLPQRNVSHPHKKLQHLAGRYLLQHLFPDFPVSLIQIADTRKPFLEDEAYHFSISHCGNYAAAIVSRSERVGIDIELPTEKVLKIRHKFLHLTEQAATEIDDHFKLVQTSTLIWSAKEAMFKWWGRGNVDFSEMLRVSCDVINDKGELPAQFVKDENHVSFPVSYKIFPELLLAWVHTNTAITKDFG